jgi:hypothetical protein
MTVAGQQDWSCTEFLAQGAASIGTIPIAGWNYKVLIINYFMSKISYFLSPLHPILDEASF